MDQLVGCETMPLNLNERHASVVDADGSNTKKSVSDEQLDSDLPARSSILYATGNQEVQVSYAGSKSIKLNQEGLNISVEQPYVKEGENAALNHHSCGIGDASTSVVDADGSNTKKSVSDGQFDSDLHAMSSILYATGNQEAQVSYAGSRSIKLNQEGLNISVEQPYVKEGQKNAALNHYSCGIGDANVRSTGSTSGKGINGAVKSKSRKKGNSFDALSSASYQEIMDALSSPVSSYSLLYERPSLRTPKKPRKKDVASPNGNAIVCAFQTPKSRLESACKNKSAQKATVKESPTNVRSLTMTGMLDGVPVRYLSKSDEKKELHGIIKGIGYLCGCQSCNYSKTINAYEFERHAGCKTSHPNDRIHLNNGKTIYQIALKIKTTPESMLFDVIQTAIGCPLDQKAFGVWKESFKAAGHKLQRASVKTHLHF